MENKHSEEIDLVTVFSSIKKGFLKFFEGIGDLIRFFIKNIKTLLLFIIVGVGISIGIFSLKKTVYISELTISHKRLNNGQCLDLVNSISADNNDTILARKLSIDIKMAKQIKNIAFKLNKVNEKAKENDSLLNYADFKIEAQVYNKKILDTLQKRILNFLESNEYAAKRRDINKSTLDKFEDKIKSQIIAVDSLKRIVDKSILPRSMGNGIILGESIDPVKVYQEGMNLYKSQLNLIEQRELNNSFEIVIGFSPAINSSNLLLNIFVGFICSFIIGLLWIKKNRSGK